MLLYLQTHLDNQQQFPNGNTAAVSLMPNLSMLPGQYTSSGISEIQPNESAKMESPAWGISESVQDKQHPVSC